jgi:serine/threonine-protein kinase
MRAMPLAPGASFARYTVEESLGDGGMGQVYRAFDTQLERRVALKILNPPTSEQGGAAVAAKLILREARAAAALNHANAVTVFEVGEHDGVPFMAMELVTGRPLRHLIGRPGIGLVRRLRWLQGVAGALGAAHAAGIVHLDVKPENVIVRDDDVAKVLDFGIARHRSFDPDLAYPARADVDKMHTLTGGAGSVVGTPRYMAPEQIGRGELDGRTDQFAWGVVAYEVLTGKSPWPPGDDLYSLFASILHVPTPDLRRLAPEVPPPIASVVARAMSKVKEERFSTMGELSAALSVLVDDLQVSSGPSLPRFSLPGSVPVSAAEAVTMRAEPDQRTAPILSLQPAQETGPASESPASLPVAVGNESVPLPPTSKEPAVARMEAPVQVTLRSGKAEAAEVPRGGVRWPTVAMAAIVVLAAVWFATARARPPEPPPVQPASPSASASGSAAAPCNDAAASAFAAGSRELRSGDWEQARRSFADAVAKDPECAPAQAKLVVIGYWTDQPSKTREALRSALSLHSRLSERDEALLHCYERVLWATPPDERGFASCLEALSEKNPKDAELAYIASDFAPAPSRQRELAQRALDIDPEYSDAWQGLAVAFLREDNEAAALETLDKCVSRVKTSVDCLAQRALVQRRMGKCKDLEATAREWIARSPDAVGPPYTLGAALAAEGLPAAAVEEALSPRWARQKGTPDARDEPLERASLAALSGDFAAAEKHAQAAFELAKAATDLEPRVDATLWLVELGLEAGKLDDVGALASDLWSRKSAWDAGARRVGFNMKVRTFEPLLLRALRLTKRMSDADWTAARSRWLESERAASGLGEEALWVLGQALPAETPDEAAEAVKTMPASVLSTATWNTKIPGLLTYAYAGRALLLAGRTDDALRILRRAAASCTALEEPLLQTQAHAWLAQALDKNGDAAGACEALAVVKKRWGASAASRTAKLAADLAKKLKCAP